MQFTKATKKKAKARIALDGPTGSGKTYSALAIASAMCQKLAVIDTEGCSASLYSDLFPFDVLELTEYSPEAYINGINAAVKAGYDSLIIDSLSHAWMGKGGALEMVDNAAARSQSKNNYAAWREVTPWHNKLVDTITHAPLHIFVTMRSKMEYVMEKNENSGKTIIRKIGLQPIQRDGVEYEFQIVLDVDLEHKAIVTKSRCPELADKVFPKVGKDFADIYMSWLNSGVEAVIPSKITEEQYTTFITALKAQGTAPADVKKVLQDKYGVNGVRELLEPQYIELCDQFLRPVATT